MAARLLRRSLMEHKRKCETCGRIYKVSQAQTNNTIYDETSCVQIKIVDPPIERSFSIYNVCPTCAMRVWRYILKLKSEAPKKCFWCEHDFGPKHPNYRKGCEGCGSNYSAFQLKKRMSPHQLAEWKYYNGEVTL